MAHIDYYLGTVSPWCYFGHDRFEQIAARHEASVTYKPIDLFQLFDRTGGVRPQARHPNRLAYRSQELARWADYLELPLNAPPNPFPNTAPSSYAIIAAQASRTGDTGRLVGAVLRAHFVDGRDIADDATLRAILQETGFDPGLVDSGLFVGAETYGRNLDQAIEAGVFGGPFYIVRETDQRFWGQDRLEFLERHLAAL
ncbi:2-hydroxychromene-2-carboxylate isomerase [Paracoccus sp. S-4012]|uniref:2-hydroxychromene-2-carboxylate isomerase n=1 Tax=Paracoccus sp. S-4012 TaxID=2665648 RepID=UPI0012AFCC4E|nr:2-hydroxychromene-2-carboxylate isomerase [Paracoccus sp. S-4012]MRX51766.1 2-hydroxychromene-2-carboxylate isomerase [Paracoccus sp. S-4012]